jgi:hypothetical protein
MRLERMPDRGDLAFHEVFIRKIGAFSGNDTEENEPKLPPFRLFYPMSFCLKRRAPIIFLALSLGSMAEEIRFNRDIRPILTTQCTGCHGGVKEAGGISFVFREKALASGDSGNPTIKPGHPELSEIMRRITSSDPEVVMPQPEHGPPLPAADVEKIRQWIAQGAPWDEHWSFVKPQDHPVPSTKNSSWPRNDIDRFILAGLEKQKPSPAPEAEPALLLRRLSIDLIGLPPTLAELDAFESAFAKNPDAAYAAEVERLLASPHYGERWAANWLDLARFADTEGLGLDRPRTAWPFRDWVVRAYNEDLPFDQFTIKQLAGDLLENPTLDDLIATNFHRQTQANGEGGTDDEEFRVASVMDRVATTWETWQGVTMGCVQCHSHPYDAIQHHEYYTSYAFFNDARDADLDNHFPTIPVPRDPARKADFARWIKERADLQQLIHGRNTSLHTTSDWQPVPSLAATSPQVTLHVKGPEIHTSGNHPRGANYQLEFPTAASLTALRIELLPVHPETALHTPEWGSVLSHITLADASGNRVEIASIIPDEPDPILNPDDSLRENATGWGAYTKIDRTRSAVLILRNPIPEASQLKLTLKHDMIGGGSFPLVTKRARLSWTTDPRWTHHLADPEVSRAKSRIAEINKALAKHSVASIPVIARQPKELARPTHLFVRGNWLEKDTALQQPGIPAVFGKLTDGAPANRLGFAQWLVSKDNPLTARVVVNRFWEQLFGTGLVETLEDFGSSGTKPSHPELLDHLALRFRDHHRWSHKGILREIVSSATYRQSAAAPQDAHANDPQNRQLGRGSRFRLTAEAIRDHGLVSSALFSPQLLGPPVFPPMPPGGWTPFKSGEKWNTPAIGQPDRYRRALYTYTKRSNPYPGFASFDAPPRDLCTKRRISSNTPLQALETLNSPAHVEFAQGLARRMKFETPGSLADKITAGYRITTSRKPDSERIQQLVSLFQEIEARYAAEPASLQGIAGTPDGGAFTVLASVLLNLDEALTK